MTLPLGSALPPWLLLAGGAAAAAVGVAVPSEQDYLARLGPQATIADAQALLLGAAKEETAYA